MKNKWQTLLGQIVENKAGTRSVWCSHFVPYWFVCFQRNGFLPYVRSGSSVVDGPDGAGNGGSSLTPPPVRTIPSKGKAPKSNRKLKMPKAKFAHSCILLQPLCVESHWDFCCWLFTVHQLHLLSVAWLLKGISDYKITHQRDLWLWERLKKKNRKKSGSAGP